MEAIAKPTEKEIEEAFKVLESAGYWAIQWWEDLTIRQEFVSLFETKVDDGEVCDITDEDVANIRAMVLHRYAKGDEIDIELIDDQIYQYVSENMMPA